MSSNKSHGRIAIFYPWPGLGAFRNLSDATRLLADHGYFIEIYTLRHPYFPEPDIKHPGIRVITDRAGVFREVGVTLPRWTRGRGGRLNHWIVINLYRPLWRRMFAYTLRKQHKELPYVCFIGMNRCGEGLVDAAPFAEMLGVPLVNWSLELSFADEVKTKKQSWLLQKEIEYSRRAAFSIVQDEWRAQVLVKENGLDSSKIILVPNAPMGTARRSPDNFLHERLAIPPGRKFVLCTGELWWYNMSLEIIEAASRWPDDYVLFMQSPRRYHTDNKYHNLAISAADPRRVILCFEPVTPEKYRTLVDSADVGLVFYNSRSPDSPTEYMRTFDIIGYSSGKLADYLYSGLPVIANEITGPSQLINSYDCGICVSHPSETGGALGRIFERYEEYSANACHCFDERLELSRHFRPVLEQIDRLVGER